MSNERKGNSATQLALSRTCVRNLELGDDRMTNCDNFPWEYANYLYGIGSGVVEVVASSG